MSAPTQLHGHLDPRHRADLALPRELSRAARTRTRTCPSPRARHEHGMPARTPPPGVAAHMQLRMTRRAAAAQAHVQPRESIGSAGSRCSVLGAAPAAVHGQQRAQRPMPRTEHTLHMCASADGLLSGRESTTLSARSPLLLPPPLTGLADGIYLHSQAGGAVRPMALAALLLLVGIQLVHRSVRFGCAAGGHTTGGASASSSACRGVTFSLAPHGSSARWLGERRAVLLSSM